MPRIDQFNAPTVARRPLQPTSLRLDAGGTFGAELGAEIQRAGQTGLSVAQKAKAEYDKAQEYRAMDAESKFVSAAGSYLNDSKSGFLLSEGVNALNTDPAHTKLSELAKQNEDGLSEEARTIYRRRIAGHQSAYSDAIERHAGQQRKVVYANAANGAVAATLTTIGDLAADDPEHDKLFLEQMDRGSQVIRYHLANEEGQPEAKISAEVAEYRSKASKLAFDNLLAKDTSKAKDFLESHRDELGVRAAEAESRLKSSAIDATVDYERARIRNASKVKGTDWTSKDAMVDAARAWKGDPETKKHLEQAVEHDADVNEKLRNDKGDELLNEAISIWSKTHSLQDPGIREIKKQMNFAPNGWAGRWERFEAGIRAEYRADRQLQAEYDKEQKKKDLEVSKEFNAMTDQQKVGLGNLQTRYFGLASKNAINDMIAIQNRAKKRVEGGGVSSESATRSTARRSVAGLLTSKEDSDGFEAMVGQWRDQFMLDNDGEEPTKKDVAEFIANELLYGDLRGSMGEGSDYAHPDKYQYQVPKEERANFYPLEPDQQKYQGSRDLAARAQKDRERRKSQQAGGATGADAGTPAPADGAGESAGGLPMRVKSSSEIPPDVRELIKADYKKTYPKGGEPSEVEIVRGYNQGRKKGYIQ